jgi:small subunit ribosomal protein S10
MKFRILLKSFDSKQITEAALQLQKIFSDSDCKVSGVISLPTKIKKFCVLRSPHVDKDSREHFEIRISKRFLDIEAPSPSILELLLKTELPSGVSCSLNILNK